MSNYLLSFNISTPDIAYERLEGELILVSLATGKYFNLNGTASDIFNLVEQGVPRQYWEEVLSNYFIPSVSMSDDINLFVSKLLSNQLIIKSSIEALSVDVSNFNLPSDYARNEWVTPEINEFSDLSDLILVDPVHDTSLKGWPVEGS